MDKDFVKDREEYSYCLTMIDAIIDQCESYHEEIIPLLKESWTIDRITKIELAIIMDGIYEIRNHVHRDIVINEAVELSKKYGNDNSYKFINGILQQVA